MQETANLERHIQKIHPEHCELLITEKHSQTSSKARSNNNYQNIYIVLKIKNLN